MRASIDELLAQRLVARRGVDLLFRKPRPGAPELWGAGSLTGQTTARGLDFADSRPYQRGDDARSIDWKVTARQGKAHTKVFAAEREQPLWIVVDQGAGMQFGSRVRFKAVQAARAAAWLAWSGSAAGDRVGGGRVADDALGLLPPQAGERGVLALLELLCRPASAPWRGASGMTGALQALRPRLRSGDRLCLIGDFAELARADEAASFTAALAATGQRATVLLVHIVDPLEAAAPPPGVYPLLRSAGVVWVDCAAAATRDAWAARHRRLVASLDSLARANGWRSLRLATDGDPSAVLAASDPAA